MQITVHITDVYLPDCSQKVRFQIEALMKIRPIVCKFNTMQFLIGSFLALCHSNLLAMFNVHHEMLFIFSLVSQQHLLVQEYVLNCMASKALPTTHHQMQYKQDVSNVLLSQNLYDRDAHTLPAEAHASNLLDHEDCAESG